MSDEECMSWICPAYSQYSRHLNEVSEDIILNIAAVGTSTRVFWSKPFIACSEICLPNLNFKLTSFEDEEKSSYIWKKWICPGRDCVAGCSTLISCGRTVTLGQTGTESALKGDNDYRVKGEHVTMQANWTDGHQWLKFQGQPELSNDREGWRLLDRIAPLSKWATFWCSGL